MHLHRSSARRFCSTTDAAADGDEPALEVQGVFTVPLAELRDLSTSTLPAAFGATVSEPVAS